MEHGNTDDDASGENAKVSQAVEISRSEMEGQPPSIVGGRPKSKEENVEKESERVTIIHFKSP